MLFSPIAIFFVVGFVWMLGLTIFLLRLSNHYNRFLKNSNKQTLQNLIEAVLSDLDFTKKDIANLKNKYATIEKENKLHIQKIGLLRFNPFKDTGGQQSFILALVDGQETGVVLSGLYSRAGTRWYAKRFAKGKGIDHELSDEEKQAIQKARQITL